MSEKITYHICTNSTYATLVKDLIKYGACIITVGTDSGDFGYDVAAIASRKFTKEQKEKFNIVGVKFMGYEGHGGYARFVLVTHANASKLGWVVVSPRKPLTPEDIEIGLPVLIHENSQFYGQSYGEGTIIGPGNYAGWWRVQWKDGDTNTYKPEDLCSADYRNNKEASRLLRKD